MEKQPSNEGGMINKLRNALRAGVIVAAGAAAQVPASAQSYEGASSDQRPLISEATTQLPQHIQDGKESWASGAPSYGDVTYTPNDQGYPDYKDSSVNQSSTPDAMMPTQILTPEEKEVMAREDAAALQAQLFLNDTFAKELAAKNLGSISIEHFLISTTLKRVSITLTDGQKVNVDVDRSVFSNKYALQELLSGATRKMLHIGGDQGEYNPSENYTWQDTTTSGGWDSTAGSHSYGEGYQSWGNETNYEDFAGKPMGDYVTQANSQLLSEIGEMHLSSPDSPEQAAKVSAALQDAAKRVLRFVRGEAVEDEPEYSMVDYTPYLGKSAESYIKEVADGILSKTFGGKSILFPTEVEQCKRIDEVFKETRDNILKILQETNQK